jgi:hypothetical protein
VRNLFVWTLLVAACNFDPSTMAGSGDGAVVDADPNAPDADPFAPDADPLAPDATPILPCADWARTPSLFDPCVDITMESDSLNLDSFGEYTYDTDNGELRNPFFGSVSHTSIVLGAGDEAPRVIVAGDFSIGQNSSLRAFGDRPILIVSWNDIVIDGDIEVGSIDVVSSATFAGSSFPGAGTNSSLCDTAADGTSQTDGGGGGGGGGFGTAGGKGGSGRNGNASNAGGDGGTALAQAFHGGCSGGDGGLGDGDAEDIGLGGLGGGAVYLNARNTLSIDGLINAAGQGGLGSISGRSGGGGGGSGGFIGLEAATLDLKSGASIAANGGGGGGGGNQGVSEPGEEGQPDMTVAVGGSGENADPLGDGGNGGFVGLAVGQVGLVGDRGGGGGGGGVGYIVFSANSTTNNASAISPSQTTIP